MTTESSSPETASAPTSATASPLDVVLTEVAALGESRAAAEEARLAGLLGSLPADSWDRLAADVLGASEEATLRASAEASAESSDEARRALEAFTPLEESFRQRVALAVSEQREREREHSADVESLDARRSLWRRRSVWAMAATVVLAVTVALLLRGNLASSGDVTLALPIPDYAVQVDGGAAAERSAPELAATPAIDEVTALGLGERLRLTLRPATAVDGAVTVRTFVAPRAGVGEPASETQSAAWRIWDGTTEVATSGAVRLSAVIGEQLDVAAGSYTLAVVVGRPEHLPAVTDLPQPSRCSALEQDADACWRLYCMHVDIRDGDT